MRLPPKPVGTCANPCGESRMDLPGFRFHGLKGKDRGRYAVDASGNWRVTFGWLDGDAVDVDLEDYH